MISESEYIAKCRLLIETKLSWGSSEHWQQQEFDNLSDKIFEQTKLLLSSSTLKRVWGKVKYESSPNRSTLDALAQFAGFQNWLHFLNQEPPNADQPETTGNERAEVLRILDEKNTIRKSSYKVIFSVGIGILILIVACFAFIKQQRKSLNFRDLQFSSKNSSTGLPNTVIFKYDVSRSNVDSVFIQQNWDRRKRFKVDKFLREYTSTYYYPGFYKAKLILNDSIAREQDVYVETNGWMGILEKEPYPIYLPDSLFKNQLSLNTRQVAALNFDYKKEAPVFSLTKVDKNFNVSADKMRFNVQLQNTYVEPNAPCQNTQLTIMGSNSAIVLSICKPGCVGEIGLMIGSKYVNGKTHDLSRFGVDFSNQVNLTCETSDQHIIVRVNDNIAYEADLKEILGKVVGVQIKFYGLGSINNIEVTQNKPSQSK